MPKVKTRSRLHFSTSHQQLAVEFWIYRRVSFTWFSGVNMSIVRVFHRNGVIRGEHKPGCASVRFLFTSSTACAFGNFQPKKDTTHRHTKREDPPISLQGPLWTWDLNLIFLFTTPLRNFVENKNNIFPHFVIFCFNKMKSLFMTQKKLKKERYTHTQTDRQTHGLMVCKLY